VGFLEDWDLSYDEIDELLTDNPSLRSFVMGYAAEVKCKNMYFVGERRVSDIYKPDDHDRTAKGDLILTYKNQKIAIEVKSIQSSSMRTRARTGLVSPYYQCDASDRRTVSFDDGSEVETTSLLVGEFDVLALNIHSFTGHWDFVFAKNSDLPTMLGATRGAAKYFTPYQQSRLLRGTIPIDLEPDPAIYGRNPFEVFDSVLADRRRGQDPNLSGIQIEES
jgi:hypothetical protein